MSNTSGVVASKNTTIRVSLTVAERRELRIAAAKADVSVGVLVKSWQWPPCGRVCP
jgi:hypothetical protein